LQFDKSVETGHEMTERRSPPKATSGDQLARTVRADPDTTSDVATLAVDVVDEGAAMRGALNVRTLRVAKQSLAVSSKKRTFKTIDLGKLSGLDTAGALYLHTLRGNGIKLIGATPGHQALLDLVGTLDLKRLPRPLAVQRWRQFIVQIGKGASDAWSDSLDIIAFVGRSASGIGNALVHPRTLRLPSVSRQISETGVDALPIIGLMAVMISIVIGYQSVAQLRPYGGEDFTVNLIAVSVLREMAVLITAIMVAGRSGSAFTAEIGAMMAGDEVDALKVMGLNPMQLLVVPRLIALTITLPLLTIFADGMGLLGGAMISKSLLEISPAQYVERVHHAVSASDYYVGLIKAPIFGFLIAVIGCMHGLRVRGNAESAGRETTRAVVKSIFVVIILDAFFSILFEKVGI
jgi:phospholipid/cholesterol/gamma-HCH transport system permease protein